MKKAQTGNIHTDLLAWSSFTQANSCSTSAPSTHAPATGRMRPNTSWLSCVPWSRCHLRSRRHTGQHCVSLPRHSMHTLCPQARTWSAVYCKQVGHNSRATAASSACSSAVVVVVAVLLLLSGGRVESGAVSFSTATSSSVSFSFSSLSYSGFVPSSLRLFCAFASSSSVQTISM